MNQTRHEIEEYRQEIGHKIETLKNAIAQTDQKMEQSEAAYNLELERNYLQLRDEYTLKKDRARQTIQTGVKDLEQLTIMNRPKYELSLKLCPSPHRGLPTSERI